VKLTRRADTKLHSLILLAVEYTDMPGTIPSSCVASRAGPQGSFSLPNFPTAARLRPQVDRPGATQQRCGEVESALFDLFAHLGATEDQLDFPVLYASAREVRRGHLPRHRVNT